jgi:hypothetical protein
MYCYRQCLERPTILKTPRITAEVFYKKKINLVILYQATRRHIPEDSILGTLNTTRTDLFSFGFSEIKLPYFQFVNKTKIWKFTHVVKLMGVS